MDRYRRLPKQFRQLLSIVASEIDTSSGDYEPGSIEHQLYLLGHINPTDLLKKEWLHRLFCYHRKKNKRITFRGCFKDSDNVRVLSGRLGHRSVVVKWLHHRRRSIQYEIDCYRRLESLGCSLPWFSTKYRFWGHRVLVMERLDPIGPYDDELKIGQAVIDQLQYIHTFGVHCDIKPGNIMKRGDTYYLIDFGGMATQPLGIGYYRWTWTPKWSSQEPHEKKQVAIPQTDLIELGYVMRAIQNWRLSHRRDDGDFRTGYKGKLLAYMEAVKRLEPGKPVNYQALRALLG